MNRRRASARRSTATRILGLILASGLLSVGPLLAAPAVADTVTDGAPPVFDGAWAGEIVYEPAEVEFRVRVDLGAGTDGDLAGTVDIPTQRMKYHPLTRVEADGTEIEMVFTKWTERADESGYFDAEFIFRGELTADGRSLEGTFKGWLVDGKDLVPFHLERIGEAGVEEPEVPTAPLIDLSAGAGELAAAFNRAAGEPRVVMLISPTCAVCLISARVVDKYLLRRYESDDLSVFVVWGPMLGKEERADAVESTAALPDPRVEHFWTAEHDLAERLAGVLGLKTGELAWDTFLVYAPGVRWGEQPPAPDTAMHVGRSLPDEQRLNGRVLFERVNELAAHERPATGDGATR